MSNKKGLLLINLGTPDSPNTKDVRKYLREFLSDPRVITVPAPIRWMLLNLIILPTRPKQSAEAYKEIWDDKTGSPLLHHGKTLQAGVANALGDDWHVEFAMRYGNPNIESAFNRFDEGSVDKIVVFPLYPQYASSSTGSTLEKVYSYSASQNRVVSLNVIEDFFADPHFIGASTEIMKPQLAAFEPDHVLFSYHGLPESHMNDVDPTKSHCLKSPNCCDALIPANRRCYRAQCVATTKQLQKTLDLSDDQCTLAFQSRLGRQPWIKPYTDEELPRLAATGIKNLAVVCPAFVADCLETLEEIGIRAKEDWLKAGGSDLRLITSLNSNDAWIHAVSEMAKSA